MNKIKKQSTKITGLIIAIIFIIFIIPLIINKSYNCEDVCIVTKWGPDIVLTFYGSILQGIIILVALSMTIRHEKRLQEEQKHNSVKPFIKAWHLSGADPKDVMKECPQYDYVFSPEKKVFKKKVNFRNDSGKSMFEKSLVIHNIGQGTALSVTIQIKYAGCENIKINDILNLGVNEKEIFTFKVVEEYMKAGKYELIFEYSDMYNKIYQQSVDVVIIGEGVHFNLKDFLRISSQIEL